MPTTYAERQLADRRQQLADLSSFPHPTYRVEHRLVGDGYLPEHVAERVLAPLDTAQLVASTIEGTSEHTVMLDIDVPAHLIASTTPGHSHLYIDVRMPWRKYKRVLRALSKAGVIEPGYYRASVKRRHTALRLPWVKKTWDDNLGGSA